MVGDWMGSIYGVSGLRHDIRLLLEHDGRYEWSERMEPDHSSFQAGRWALVEGETVIELSPDHAGATPVRSRRWTVLSVTSCEGSNVLLVLCEVFLASRNLPIIFYRVHCDGRGYGSGWQERLAGSRTNPGN